jgi:hypothetical protein
MEISKLIGIILGGVLSLILLIVVYLRSKHGCVCKQTRDAFVHIKDHDRRIDPEEIPWTAQTEDEGIRQHLNRMVLSRKRFNGYCNSGSFFSGR